MMGWPGSEERGGTPDGLSPCTVGKYISVARQRSPWPRIVASLTGDVDEGGGGWDINVGNIYCNSGITAFAALNDAC